MTGKDFLSISLETIDFSLHVANVLRQNGKEDLAAEIFSDIGDGISMERSGSATPIFDLIEDFFTKISVGLENRHKEEIEDVINRLIADLTDESVDKEAEYRGDGIVAYKNLRNRMQRMSILRFQTAIREKRNLSGRDALKVNGIKTSLQQCHQFFDRLNKLEKLVDKYDNADEFSTVAAGVYSSVKHDTLLYSAIQISYGPMSYYDLGVRSKFDLIRCVDTVLSDRIDTVALYERIRQSVLSKLEVLQRSPVRTIQDQRNLLERLRCLVWYKKSALSLYSAIRTFLYRQDNYSVLSKLSNIVDIIERPTSN